MNCLKILRHRCEANLLVCLQLCRNKRIANPLCVTAARATSLSAFSSAERNSIAIPFCFTAAKPTSLSAFNFAERCRVSHPCCTTAARPHPQLQHTQSLPLPIGLRPPQPVLETPLFPF